MRTWATLLCLTTEDELTLAIIPHLIHFESCCLGIHILPSAYLLFNHSRVASRSRSELERPSIAAPQITPSCSAPGGCSLLSVIGSCLADSFFSEKTGKRANLQFAARLSPEQAPTGYRIAAVGSTSAFDLHARPHASLGSLEPSPGT